jgi:hypothetical protein
MFMSPTHTFIRPSNTTAYAAGQLLANSTTAGLVVPMRFPVGMLNGRGKINGARIATTNPVVTLASFILHLFNALPVPTNGDGGALAVATGLTYLGPIACDMATGSFVVAAVSKTKRFAAAIPIPFDQALSDPNIYGLFEVTAAYVPISAEQVQASLEVENN